LFIHQTSAPGLPGNEGLKLRPMRKSSQTSDRKLKKGEMPPTVTIDEMKKLKVL